jgi:hypothetical protein
LGPGRGSRTRVPHPARTERQIEATLKSFKKTKVSESIKSHSGTTIRQKERRERRGSSS